MVIALIVMEKATVVGYWDGQELGFVEYACIQSFISAGYNFELYTFDGVIGAPPETIIKSAKEFMSVDERDLIFAINGRFSDISDLFRCLIVYETGHTYADLDMLYLDKSPLERTEFFGLYSIGRVNNAFFRFPKGSPILSWMIKQMRSLEVFEKPRGSSGPILFSEAISIFGRFKHLTKPFMFYPVSFLEIDKMLLKKNYDHVQKKVSRSVAVHLWGEFLRKRICCLKHLQETDGWLFKTLESNLLNYDLRDVKYRECEFSPAATNNLSRISVKRIKRIPNTFKRILIFYFRLIRNKLASSSHDAI